MRKVADTVMFLSASSLGAQAGRISGFFGQAEDLKRFTWFESRRFQASKISAP